MLGIGVPALKIISLSFILAGFNIVSSSLFQALAHGVLSLWVSLVGQLVVLLRAAYIFSLSGNLENVWWSFPLAELFSTAMCATFLRYVYKKEVKPIAEEEKQNS